MASYDHRNIETKWQQYWEQNQTFAANDNSIKEKYYVLDMFPYPSGAGLHVGHPLGYTATDIIARKKRHQNFEVLHPMGWDAFGLPAENYAIKTGIHPSISTAENIQTFKRQIKSLGFSYDWDREVDSTDPQYYKWSQWIFLQLYHKGLLYQDEKPMNWCPKCKVVAANEEVEDGLHERCGSVVEKRKMRQWMFRITDYAERLLGDLDKPNVVLIHGYNSHGNQGWFKTIKDQLFAAGIQCEAPSFPGDDLPNYEDWVNFFEKEVKDKISPQTIIITHSLGHNFLVNYLSEQELNFAEALLVAPPADDKIGCLESFFKVDIDWDKVRGAADNFRIIGAQDDPYIPVSDFENIAHELQAHLELYENGGHFSMNEDQCAPLEFHVQKIIDSVIDWPEKIRAMQRHWIGKSHGCNVDWSVDEHDLTLSTYTTTVDTIFGVTFAVISPEHPVLEQIVTEDHKAKVADYINVSNAKSDLERTELNKEKTGVFTGAHLINPLNGEKVPLYVADYVLMSYGTGVVMGVPAHDQRDLDFANKYNIPVIEVVQLKNGDNFVYDEVDKHSVDGVLFDSGEYSGLSILEARKKITDDLSAKGKGEAKTQYKLRDWIFTRQRYWGEPIPIVFDKDGNEYPLDASELPLVLPESADYEPSDDGASPLAKIKEWVNIQGYVTEQGTVKTVKDGEILEGNSVQSFTRETSTMPNWAGSSWYWLRFMDAKNENEFCASDKEMCWGPVDLYVGGAEHAVLHLLYARFWHKALYDLGLVSTKEPFKKLVNQGMIVSFAYQNKNGGLVPINEVEEKDGEFIETATGEVVEKVTAKMSKSLKNVVNPDDIVNEFGADTLRCYEMFMGPFEQSKVWETTAVAGMRRFLDKIYRAYTDKIKVGFDENSDKDFQVVLHQTIKTLSHHIDDFKFNTALSQLMVCMNQWGKTKCIAQSDAEKLIICCSPYMPHLAEELWNKLGHQDTIVFAPWPEYDEALLVADAVIYAVQVNGKVRAELELAPDVAKDDALSQAKALENVVKWTEGKDLVKEIFVPGKIIGLVVK